MESFRGFVLAAQYGERNVAVHEQIWSLKWLAEAKMVDTQAEGIDSIHLLFRVDGKYAVYNCAKAEKLSFSRVHRSISVDLGVPISAHKDKSVHEFRIYICDCIDQALNIITASLIKKKICLDCHLLYEKWQGVKEEYLALPLHPGADQPEYLK